MIDLHVHSYVSDGTDSPSEIIKMAFEKKIKAIALTDHDSIEGLLEAEKAALKLKVNFLKGIEISASYKDNKLLHIIGLGINTENEYFLKAYNNMKRAREEGMDRILNILEKQGILIDMETLRGYAVGKYLDRQAIPKYFVDKNISPSVPNVWQEYLDPIPYGRGELIKVEEALDIIKKSGGISILAHYHKKIGFYGYNTQEVEENIKYLVGLGLQGIEEYYPSYTRRDSEYVHYIINKYGLIPSGGTDFHGKNRPEVTLGRGQNDFFVPDSVYENIFRYLHKKTNIRKEGQN
ncbi:MAG: PHP domain-containing protein [Clostridiaceae bacterium]|nr:PHP domain-containing protein [Clostridiaceae bacterium]